MTWQDIENRFRIVKTVPRAVSMVRSFGLCHSWYSHYTTVDVLKKILQTGELRLTRADAETFDDTLEQKRFGDERVLQRLYFSCFTHERAESAAMWGLYCPPTYKAVRIVVHRYDLKTWVEKFRCKENWLPNVMHGYPAFGDMVYVGETGSQVENNLKYRAIWDTMQTVRMPRPEGKACWARITGRVKDQEWQFEKETRLFVKVKEPIEECHFYVPFPLAFMNTNTVEITLSPWADENEQQYVRSQVEEVLSSIKYSRRFHFRPSRLSGGLMKWAKAKGM